MADPRLHTHAHKNAVRAPQSPSAGSLTVAVTFLYRRQRAFFQRLFIMLTANSKAVDLPAFIAE